MVSYKSLARFGYPAYRVGDDGTVWSRRLPGSRYSPGRLGKVWKQLKPTKNPKHGYYSVALIEDGKSKRFYVHQLVLEVFVGPRPSGMEVRHFPDSDKGNNTLGNLSWSTRSDNHADKVVHGTDNRGVRHWNAKLAEEDVLTIRNRLDKGEDMHLLAGDYGVSYTTIDNIKRRETWKHL